MYGATTATTLALIESHTVNEPTDSTVASVTIAHTVTFDEIELTRVCQVLKIGDRRTLEGAASECERELQVRDRCYGNWIKDGKLSRIDATDRYKRLTAAKLILEKLLDSWPEAGTIAGTETDAVPF